MYSSALSTVCPQGICLARRHGFLHDLVDQCRLLGKHPQERIRRSIGHDQQVDYILDQRFQRGVTKLCNMPCALKRPFVQLELDRSRLALTSTCLMIARIAQTDKSVLYYKAITAPASVAGPAGSG